MLRTLDWTKWEAEYSRQKGQPPIHPRVLASIWLCGLSRKIKSSRPLEYACSHNITFLRLAEGRRPDHSTLAAFFTKFRDQLKDLFKQAVRLQGGSSRQNHGSVGRRGDLLSVRIALAQ